LVIFSSVGFVGCVLRVHGMPSVAAKPVAPIRTYPVTIKDKRVVLGIAGDISDRKRAFEKLEARVQERTADLARTNEALQKEISRRAEIEEELLEKDQRYQLATAAAKVGVWDWNIETGGFYLDPNLKGLLGYSDSEIPNDLGVGRSTFTPWTGSPS
jgi:PAS domain-containing protein